MKKRLLLFAFSAIALTSCKDDDLQGYELDLLKGQWKRVKTEIISGQDKTTVISTDVPAGCDTKSTIEFRTDLYTAYNAFTGIGTNCTSNLTEGDYMYNADTKDLVISYDNDSERPFKIVILSSTELRIRQEFNKIDINGDQIIDDTYITYKR